MKKDLSLVGGLGLGAGLMYLLDPDRGPRRRAAIRDQWVHASHQARHEMRKTLRDLGNRTQGQLAKALSPFLSETVPDEVLVERVRARMGHVVSHPHAIHVTADAGGVTLYGDILAREVSPLLRAVGAVPGVKGVETELAAHETAEHVSSLQGGKAIPRRGERWSPTARLFSAVAGAALAAYGLRRGGPLGIAVGFAGLGLLASGTTDTTLYPAESAASREPHPAPAAQEPGGNGTAAALEPPAFTRQPVGA